MRPILRWPSHRITDFWKQTVFGLLIASVMGCLSVLWQGQAIGQPPGTVPSSDAFDPQEGRLPIQSFLFLSESGSQVVMPDTTWEQLERLQRREGGKEAISDRFVLQSLDVTGQAHSQRAELEVTIVVTIEPTDGRFVKIPLRMGNFHRLAEVEVTGIEDHYMTIAPRGSGASGSGYQWWVRSDRARKATLRMKVSSRIENKPVHSMDFQFPPVPATVNLTVDASDITGEIISGAKEVVVSTPIDDHSTKIKVEGNGGSFTLRWGMPIQDMQSSSLLEVESRVDVQWDSPQDQPIASVRMTAKSVKGSIKRFQLRLPPGSVVVSAPRLGTGGQAVEFIAIEGDLVEVVIPEDEQQQRIDLVFDLQLAVDQSSSEAPLRMTVPSVVDALWHRGLMTLRVGDDYRLRWEARPWVHGEPTDYSDDSATDRSYRFRFDRGNFELPIWLSAKERRLRLSTHYEVTIRNAVASLQMQVNVNGSVAENRLRFDDASWDVLSITNEDSGERVETFFSGDDRVIELSEIDREENIVLLLIAERTIGQDLGDIEFPLPRILKNNDEVTTQESTLDLIGKGRTVMAVDMSASEGLVRTMVAKSANAAGSVVSRFRLSNFGESVTVVGTLQDQPLRIGLAVEATVEIDGSQILSTIDWTVTSPLDLEGRLPIRIPRHSDSTSFSSRSFPSRTMRTSEEEDDAFGGVFDDTSDEKARDASLTEEPWVVTVQGVPATLRKLDNDRYELISERLSSGTMNLRWRHVQEMNRSGGNEKTQEVALPRPRIPDVAIRGAIEVTLRGDSRNDLIAMDSRKTGLPDTKFLHTKVLDSLPREPLRLRLRPHQSRQQDLSIEQLVIRSAIGRRTRYEQILARIRQGSELRFRVASLKTDRRVGDDPTQDLSIEAFVDGAKVPVESQQGSLVVTLPGDQQVHTLEMRVWVPESSLTSESSVQPIVELPLGVGRVYWQVITATDSHVIWASPTVGRAMSWKFDRWKLFRQSSLSDSDLSKMVGVTSGLMPPGNRYLFVGTDLLAFKVMIVSRTILWLVVGSIVLSLAIGLTYLPVLRHPLTAVAAAIAFTGLLVIAPDAAVLAGQLGLISLVLVIVMIAIRSLVLPREGTRNDRVFVNTTPSNSQASSTHIPAQVPGLQVPGLQAPELRRGGVSETAALPPPSNPSTHPPSGPPPSGAGMAS